MATLIDASVVIAAERGRLDLDRLLEERAEQFVALAEITASELLHGVQRAATAAQRGCREAFVERLLAGLPIIAFDLVVARVHARLWAELAAKGTVAGAHDLLIRGDGACDEWKRCNARLAGFQRSPALRSSAGNPPSHGPSRLSAWTQ